MAAGGGRLAVGAGKVAEIDSDGVFGRVWVQLGMDDGDGAKEEIGDVGENGGAAGGDEVRGEKLVKFVEGVVDAHGRGEFVAVGGERLEEVGGRFCSGARDGVFEAETEFQVVGLGAATATGGGAVEATIGGSGRWGSCG
jgi:hypothetical protein